MSLYHDGEKINEEETEAFYEQIDKWIEEGNQEELEKISICHDEYMFEDDDDTSIQTDRSPD
jgi:hypothetical protein